MQQTRVACGLPAGRLFEVLDDEPHRSTGQADELDVRDAMPGGHPPGGYVIHAVHYGASWADVAGAGDGAQDELWVTVTPAGVVDEQPPRCKMGHSRDQPLGQAPGSGGRAPSGAAGSVTDSAPGAARHFLTFPQVSMPFKSCVVHDYLD